MASYKIEKVTDPVRLGEGPHWDHDKKVLYFTDIEGCGVHKFDPATKSLASLTFQEPVSIIIPIEGQKDRFIITLGRNVAILTWDGVSKSPQNVEVLVSVDQEKGKETNRINDGKADPSGRLWAGTMGPYKNNKVTPERGMLFSLDKDRKAVTHVTKIGIANGLAWSLDNKTMYYIDSATRRVDAFDFDIKAGKITNRRTIFDYPTNGVAGFPDGQAIDADGNLWIASYDANLVIQVNPSTGKLLKRVEMPALKITSVAFGGEKLDELYVTSARDELTDEQLRRWPLSGCTFRVTGLGVTGLPGQPVSL
ncbi:regucalcin-like [Schistocerca nitens]|uniref:regucalcin-like n=1 Tax=Schistocerca nitens TaxID=7011 RepID=UPI002118407C|nr:regucalcin-like [Schistocerca nitens]